MAIPDSYLSAAFENPEKEYFQKALGQAISLRNLMDSVIEYEEEAYADLGTISPQDSGLATTVGVSEYIDKFKGHFMVDIIKMAEDGQLVELTDFLQTMTLFALKGIARVNPLQSGESEDEALQNYILENRFPQIVLCDDAFFSQNSHAYKSAPGAVSVNMITGQFCVRLNYIIEALSDYSLGDAAKLNNLINDYSSVFSEIVISANALLELGEDENGEIALKIGIEEALWIRGKVVEILNEEGYDPKKFYKVGSMFMGAACARDAEKVQYEDRLEESPSREKLKDASPEKQVAREFAIYGRLLGLWYSLKGRALINNFIDGYPGFRKLPEELKEKIRNNMIVPFEVNLELGLSKKLARYSQGANNILIVMPKLAERIDVDRHVMYSLRIGEVASYSLKDCISLLACLYPAMHDNLILPTSTKNANMQDQLEMLLDTSEGEEREKWQEVKKQIGVLVNIMSLKGKRKEEKLNELGENLAKRLIIFLGEAEIENAIKSWLK